MMARQVLLLLVVVAVSGCKRESRLDTWVDGYCDQISIDLGQRAKKAAERMKSSGEIASGDTRRELGLEFHSSLLFCLNTREGTLEAHSPLEKRETEATLAYGESNEPPAIVKALEDLAAVAQEIRRLPIAK